MLLNGILQGAPNINIFLSLVEDVFPAAHQRLSFLQHHHKTGRNSPSSGRGSADLEHLQWNTCVSCFPTAPLQRKEERSQSNLVLSLVELCCCWQPGDYQLSLHITAHPYVSTSECDTVARPIPLFKKLLWLTEWTSDPQQGIQRVYEFSINIHLATWRLSTFYRCYRCRHAWSKWSWVATESL